MLEGAELLQGLRTLRLGGRELDVTHQELPPVGVESHVLPVAGGSIAVAQGGDAA